MVHTWERAWAVFLLCWKIFADADSSIITALAELGQAAYPNEEMVAAIEKFVCLLYLLYAVSDFQSR